MKKNLKNTKIYFKNVTRVSDKFFNDNYLTNIDGPLGERYQAIDNNNLPSIFNLKINNSSKLRRLNAIEDDKGEIQYFPA